MAVFPFHRARPTKTARGVGTGFLALIFLFTGAAVYWIGQKPISRANQFAAVARVSVPDRPGLSAEAIQREILSDASLGCLVGLESARTGDGNPISQGANLASHVRPNLRVTSELVTASRQWQTTIRYTGDGAEEAVNLVNRLAERFAASQRAAEPTQPMAAAHEPAEDAAQTELAKARAELDQFVQQHFAQLQERKSRLRGNDSTASPVAPAESPQKQAAGSSTVDNPKWVELNDRMAEMEQKRAELLLSRTAMHPSVRELDADMARLDVQLKATPRRIPGDQKAGAASQPSEPAPRGSEPSISPKAPAAGLAEASDVQPLLEEDAAAAQRCAELRRAVEQAQQRCQELATAQQPPDWPQFTGGAPQVQLAERCEPLEAAKAFEHLFLVALLAGLTMATAVGMVSLGMVEPPLSTTADVQAALPVPIVGVISTNGPETTPATATRWPGLARWIWGLSGILLMALLAIVLAVVLT